MPEFIGAVAFLLFVAAIGAALLAFWAYVLVVGVRWLVDNWTRRR